MSTSDMTGAVITLTTDFGMSDSYVAQMKGVMLGINGQAQLVDVTHLVPAQDVFTGALLLEELFPAFPPGTIHLAVIDPGVGSARRIVAAEIGTQRYVAPDNGLLGLVAERAAAARIVEVREARYWRAGVSSTFHGRDIMAPVAAHWSLGVDIGEFGPKSLVPLVKPPCPAALNGGDWIEGEVIAVDHFGNLVTNISAEDIAEWPSVVVEIGGHTVAGLQQFYSQASRGALLMLLGSSGRLEVAANGGHAAEMLRSGRGARVVVRPEVPASESSSGEK